MKLPKQNGWFIPRSSLDKVINPKTMKVELLKPISDSSRSIKPVLTSKATEDYCKVSKQLFAILVLLDQVSRFAEFAEQQITDESLPFQNNAETISKRRFMSFSPNMLSTQKLDLRLIPINPWPVTLAEAFYRQQWTVLSRIFRFGEGEGPPEYHIYDDEILPFICNEEEFQRNSRSQVWKIGIHPSHVEFVGQTKKVSYPVARRFLIQFNASKDPVYLAVKRFSSKKTFEQERNMLVLFKDESKAHLIDLLATYELKSE